MKRAFMKWLRRLFWRNSREVEAIGRMRSGPVSPSQRKEMLKRMGKGDLARLLVLSELFASWAVERYGIDYDSVIAALVKRNGL